MSVAKLFDGFEAIQETTFIQTSVKLAGGQRQLKGIVCFLHAWAFLKDSFE